MIKSVKLIGIIRLIAACAILVNVSNAAAQVGADSPSWPRTFTSADGSTTEIKQKPQRILSTSVSITGTLLSIDAPVIASSAASNGQFFEQWQSIAGQKKVEKLWPAGGLDLEMIYVYAPDLIVVSTSGADSVYPHIAQLRQIAPTILLDYGKQSWQKLAIQLGEATGREAEVAVVLQNFDNYITENKAKIKLPEGKANIISYFGPGTVNPISTENSPHAILLKQLGFTIESADPAWQTDGKPITDFVWAQYENLTQLTAPTTFLIRATAKDANEFMADRILANLPSVKTKQVYGLGANSFRIDFYSAKEIIDDIVNQFSQND